METFEFIEKRIINTEYAFDEILLLREKCNRFKYKMYNNYVTSTKLSCLFIKNNSILKKINAKSYGFSYQKLNTYLYDEAPQSLIDIWELAEDDIGREMSYCLINIYENRHDYIGWHKDKEAIFNIDDQLIESPIYSVSLGSVRTFSIKSDNGEFSKDYTMRDGDVIIMRDPFQSNYQHKVKKMTVKEMEEFLKEKGYSFRENGWKRNWKFIDNLINENSEYNPIRINLTFRCVL